MSLTRHASDIHRVALICYGGIGDVLLFSPVAVALKAALPQVHLTLFVEDRSLTVKDLIPDVEAFHPLPMHLPRHQLFFHLERELKRRHYDAVLSTGTSPFIPALLAASGVKYRVGYQGRGPLHRLLHQAAPVRGSLYASQMHWALAEHFLQGLGVKVPTTVALRPHILPPTEPELESARQLLETAGLATRTLRQTVVIHPGVSRVSLQKGIDKTWSPANWAQLMLSLDPSVRVALVGGPDDQDMVEAICEHLPPGLDTVVNLFGQTRNLRELSALMTVADAVVCVDSSPMHLAVGLERPTVALFGPTDEKKLIPLDIPTVKVLRRDDLACRPCLWDTRQSNCSTSDCLKLSPETVLVALHQLLGLASHPVMTPSH